MDDFDRMPTQEELDDAIVEDTIRCARCRAPYTVTETYLFGERAVCEECAQDEIDEQLVAFAEALKLQSHYAESLNQHDGGSRCGFGSVTEWLDRLRERRWPPFHGELG